VSARPLILLGTAAALLVAACGPRETTPEQAAAELARPVPPEALPRNPNVTVERTIAFECDGNFPVTAIYGRGPDGEADVVLVIMGQSRQLQRTEAASGVRYQGVPGLQPDEGIVWWEKDGEAIIMTFPWDSDDPMRDATPVRTCRVRG
jgi:membrane-bound inhibitor of C-type lysozyme